VRLGQNDWTPTLNYQQAGNEINLFAKQYSQNMKEEKLPVNQSWNATILPVGPKITKNFIEHDAKRSNGSEQIASQLSESSDSD
jgi:hypothetical protein